MELERRFACSNSFSKRIGFMKKLLFLLLVSVCFVSMTFGTSESYEFMGTLQLPDKSIITYKLEFTEDQGVITGQSITDFAGAHRTVANISGTADFDKKTITFRELENMATKSDQADEDFCFIYLPKAVIKIRNKKSIIQGHFYSQYSDGTTCIDGDMYLISEKDIFRKMDNLSGNVLVKKKDKAKIEENMEVMSKILKNDYLKVGESLQIKTSEERVYIFVCDEQHEDNDRITISVEGVMHEEVVVTKEKKSFKIDLINEETIIKITAVNEGLAPPNSASVVVSNPSVKVPIITKLKKGEEAEILIKKSI